MPRYSPAPWAVAQCDDCSFVFLRNPPAYQAMEEDFAWEKTHAEKRAKTGGSTPLSPLIRRIRARAGMAHRDKQAAFRRWFRDGHVLDIGCGTGTRIAPPMTPYGIELSRGLHARADATMRARGGYCIHGAGATAIWSFPEQSFDGIVMFSYLEHEVDIQGVLRGAHRALKPEGTVFIRVPNYASLNRRIIGAKWCGFRHPDHVNYFTLASLRDAAARTGFRLGAVNGLTRPFDDNISAILTKADTP